jgi:formylglycine-generating enzyme required for sulfatase activity/serine/threonine protein kinase
MGDPNQGHPSARQLSELVLGRLGELEATELGAHVWECAVCLQRLESGTEDTDPFLAKLQALHLSKGVPPGASEEDATIANRRSRNPGDSAGEPRPPLGRSSAATPPFGIPEPETNPDFHLLLDPPATPHELGRLAQYRVLRLLGEGGMGMVFEAVDEKLRRTVALKVLKPHLLGDPAARQRFLREARATAAIRHEHVVTIHQVGEDRGTPFLAMELLRGEPLDRHLERGGRRALTEVLRLARDVAEGLVAAHACGLIHRDVKPGNVWLEAPAGPPRGEGAWHRAKLLDFGLVWNPQEDVQVTATGVVVGTPAFMSPEQARHAPLDARSDLFSFGCLLYRLCTGRSPFEGATTMAILTALAVDNPPPIRELNPEVPPALADLVMRLLAKNPADRPPSAQEVLEALQAISDGDTGLSGQGGPSARSPRRVLPPTAARGRRVVFVAAALLVGVGLVAAVLAFRFPTGDQDRFIVETDDPELTFRVAGEGVTLHDQSTGRDSSLNVLDHDPASGEFLVQVTDADARPEARDRTFWLQRGERVAVRGRSEMGPAPGQTPPPAVAPFAANQAKLLQVCWADHLRRPAVVRNSLGMKLLLVPPGEFLMGASEEEGGRAWELPRHTVRLTRPFFLGACEVTVGQFRAFVAATGYRTDAEADGLGSAAYQDALEEYHLLRDCHWRNPGFTQDDAHPVCCISWNDAVRFCEWLSKKEGQSYRLPREAEWEYACRAGTVTPFHTGAKLSAQQARIGAKGTEHVGSYAANAFGLYDMHGNVAEWCQDGCRRYGPGPVTDPDGATKGLGEEEKTGYGALRGGCWVNPSRGCRSAARNAIPETGRTNETGFRVLWAPEERTKDE